MNNGIFRGLVTMVIGILLIVMSDGGMELLIRLAGIAFFLPALLSLINVYIGRKGAKKLPVIAIALIDVGSIAFGLWLIAFPMTFQDAFVKLISALLFIVALHQLYVVFSTHRYVNSKWYIFIVPMLIEVASVFIFFCSWPVVTTVAIILGVCAFVLAVSDIVIAVIMRNSAKNGLAVIDGGKGEVINID